MPHLGGSSEHEQNVPGRTTVNVSVELHEVTGLVTSPRESMHGAGAIKPSVFHVELAAAPFSIRILTLPLDLLQVPPPQLLHYAIQLASANMKQTHNYFAVLSPYDDDEEVEDVDEGKGKVIQKSPPPSPSTPPASGSPLTDKLPAELRLKMFELVLRSQYCLVNVGHLPRWKQGHL